MLETTQGYRQAYEEGLSKHYVRVLVEVGNAVTLMFEKLQDAKLGKSATEPEKSQVKISLSDV